MGLKIRVYEEKQKRKEVFLKLRNRHDGGIAVVACDANGERHPSGNLITFRPTGEVFRHPGVSESIGLPLDKYGRLMFTK